MEKQIDITFGRQNEVFMRDFGIFMPPGKNVFAVPNTGVIWKVTKE